VNRYVIKNPANVMIVPLKRWRRGAKLASLGKDSGIATLLRPLTYIDPIQVTQDDSGLHQSLFFCKKDMLSRWETSYLKRLCRHLGFCCLDCLQHKGENKELLEGIRLSLKQDISDVSAFNTLLTIARFLKHRKQIPLVFTSQFDAEVGSSEVREFLQGYLSFATLKEKMEETLISFYDKSRYCCLYKPLPRVVTPEIIKS